MVEGSESRPNFKPPRSDRRHGLATVRTARFSVDDFDSPRWPDEETTAGFEFVAVVLGLSPARVR